MDISLVMFKTDGERHDFPIKGKSIVIGRKNTCDLRIPLPQVSREHCRIEIRDDDIYLEDLGSSNGTFHNGDRIMEEVELDAGDQIVIGPVHFTVVINGRPAEIREPVMTVLPDSAADFEPDILEAPHEDEEDDDDIPPPPGDQTQGPTAMLQDEEEDDEDHQGSRDNLSALEALVDSMRDEDQKKRK